MSDSLADVEALALNRYREAFVVSPGFLSPAALRLHRKALGFARKAADARAANANRIARNARPIDQGQPGGIAEAMKIMAKIVAKRLVEHLERAGFVVMKKPPAVGAATLGRGYERPS